MLTRFITGVALSAALSCAAMAGPINVVGGSTNNDDDPGDFKAVFSYSFNALTNTGTLTVDMENTTPSGNGFLTGFLFGKTDLGAFDSISLASSPNASWKLALDDNGAPFDSFEYGAALGGDFLGGGPPEPGIAAGDSFTFEFEFEGGNAKNLTTSDFLQADANGRFMVVRFRGGDMGGEGSDKVLGMLVIIPLPAPVWMAGAGLLGVIGYRLKRRSA